MGRSGAETQYVTTTGLPAPRMPSSRPGLAVSMAPGSGGSPASRSSLTRPTTASSTPRSSARRTILGVHYRPRTKSKRGRQGRRGGSPASLIHLRRPLAERPAAATNRQPPGHWEADLLLCRTYEQAVLTLHKRHSRLLFAVRLFFRFTYPSQRQQGAGRRLPCNGHGAGRLAGDDLRAHRPQVGRPVGTGAAAVAGQQEVPLNPQ